VSDYPLCGTNSGSDNIQKAFVATLGTLKAILLLASIIISWFIRKQPSEFNEAKAIAFSVYNQSFCIVALLAVWLVIPDNNYEIKYILRSIIVLWGCIMTIFFIYYKKLFYLAIGKNQAFSSRRSSSMSSSFRESKHHSSSTSKTGGQS